MLNCLNEDTLLIIFKEILFINDKYNFIIINKDNYYLLKKKLIKYKLFYYLNNDYLNFYNLLKNENYSSDEYFMNRIILKAFMKIPILEVSKVCSMYDLRFIFELMFNGYGINSEEIKLISKPHFYVHFYNVILNCLNDSREKTLKNISNSKFLFSLQKHPKFSESIRSKKDFIWNSIVQ
tara:strand:- start:154 stop:693 length:540 start_codon:yes stop_codon:yes gene_type:complete